MSNMFSGCGTLAVLDVSGFHMGNVAKLAGMFTNCRSLEIVDISHFDMKRVTDLSNLFSGCSKLKSVSLVCARENSVTNISNLFSGCSSLTSVSLGGFDNNKITNMSRLFYNCRNLQNIDLSHFSTANVTDTSYMFGNCSGLTELKLDGFQVSAVKNMEHMFENCSKLERLDLGAFSTANAENMSSMFSGCFNLQSLNLAQFNTAKVTDLSNLFSGCSKLTDVSVKHFNTGNVRNMAYMFSGCAGLTGIEAENFNTANVTDMSNMFSGCEGLKTLDISGFDGSSVTSTEYMFERCKSLTALDLSSFGAGSLLTAESMFQNCESLKSLNLRNFKASNARTMRSMFSKCYDLESIDLDGFDTSCVESMHNMFQECMSLKILDVSSFDTSRVQDMYFMFNKCESLEELDLSGFDTGSVTTMEGMLSSCKSLKRLDLSRFDTSKVTSMSAMFAGCAVLKSFDIGSFDTANVTDMSSMFIGCRGLENIDINHFDTSRVRFMGSMFAVCDELKSLDLSGFDLGRLTDASLMFFGSPKLTRIHTPCNLGVAVALPHSTPMNDYNEVWYHADGTKTQQLPMNLSYSIVIERDRKPTEQTASLEVSKAKTAYMCGEVLNLDDLTVKYRDANGALSVVTNYTTNAAEIDMNVPGKKKLTVTYRAGGSSVSASVELTVTYVLQTQNVTVTVDDGACVYDGTPAAPSVEVRVVLPDGTSKELISGEDYTVSYQNNRNAYENAEDGGVAPKVRITGIHDYSGSVSASFRIRKARLVITARTRKVAVGEAFFGVSGSDAYEISGLCGKDTLLREPVFTVTDEEGNEAVVDTAKAGARYRIMPEGADAGQNYDITYRGGVIVIVENQVSCTVVFKTEAAQTDAQPYAVYYDITAGSLLKAPGEPEFAGYHFAGWYKDAGFLQPWDFETDIVQEDITLYACLLSKAAQGDDTGLQLCVQDVMPQTYTGSAIKPKVIVYAADGATPLKAGKDYTIRYANNLKAVRKKKDGMLPDIGTAAVQNEGGQQTLKNLSGSFTTDCPYVVITGKGNYTETVYKNFYILPAKIATNGNTAPASGFSIKYTDQLVKNDKKAQNPFMSIKYKKGMKLGTDYTLTLKADEDVTCDAALATDILPQEWVGKTVYNSKSKKYAAPSIPAGYAGTFTLTVTGKGNYTGKIIQSVYLADDASGLMKNARITLGKNQKKTAWDSGGVLLTPGYYDAERKNYYALVNGKEKAMDNGEDLFTVSVKTEGKTVYLKYNPIEEDSDYFISYTNNDRVGTATLTLSGNPRRGYFGQKSVTFQITGTPFSAKTVEVKEYDDAKPNAPQTDAFRNVIPYTGKAVTQNRVALTVKGTQDSPVAKKLTYGEHYTISYKKNVKTGTAVMTFTAKPKSGYNGSFQKTFQITAQELSKGRLTMTAQNKDAPTAFYSKNGAKLSFGIIDEAGKTLCEGTDYTVKYKNNSAVTTAQTPENKQPLMTVTGRGNYTGAVEINFKVIPLPISDAIDDGTVTVSCAQVQRKDAMHFQDFRLRLMEGKKTMGEGETKDYIIDDADCTPEGIKAYADALESGTALPQEPKVTIVGKGGFSGTKTVGLGKYLYADKLSADCLYVVVSEGAGQSEYTGGQVTPKVAVYYGEKTAVKAAKTAKVTEEDSLTAQGGSYRLTKLTETGAETAGDGYTLCYGANIAAGKNKGSVTVTGTGKYGGSVTVRFEIGKKPIY